MTESILSEDEVKPKKRSGYLFIDAGCLFSVAAAAGKQPAFYGLGAMFIAIGAANLKKAK